MVDIPIVDGALDAVRAVCEWLQSRNSRAEKRWQTASVLLQEFVEIRANDREQERRLRDAVHQSTYPLATMGAIAAAYSSSNPLTPRLLIPADTAPMRTLSSQVITSLREFDHMGAFLLMPAGVQTIRRVGELEARHVALWEFGHSPSIVVFGEQMSARATEIRALISNLLPPVNGDSSFVLPVATVGPNAEVLRVWRPIDDQWSCTDLASAGETDVTAAGALATLVITVVGIYWQNHNVSWVDQRGTSYAELVRLTAAPRTSPISRLEAEVAELDALEGAEVVIEELSDDELGILVHGPVELLYVVTASYPQERPEVYVMTGTGAERLPLIGWSPDNSLAQLYNTVRDDN